MQNFPKLLLDSIMVTSYIHHIISFSLSRFSEHHGFTNQFIKDTCFYTHTSPDEHIYHWSELHQPRRDHPRHVSMGKTPSHSILSVDLA